jgi:hypothetical protein
LVKSSTRPPAKPGAAQANSISDISTFAPSIQLTAAPRRKAAPMAMPPHRGVGATWSLRMLASGSSSEVGRRSVRLPSTRAKHHAAQAVATMAMATAKLRLSPDPLFLPGKRF